jgi:hypothetical protein
MICPTCKGKRVISEFYYTRRAIGGLIRRYRMVPCSDCSGSGIASCCDAAGSQQPEPESEEKKMAAQAQVTP